MLDRVALHQTRLRTPGVSLDAKGVAVGSKGLVLLPSLDRLVGFLALYTSTTPLTELLSSLTVDVVRSKLGNREVILAFAAEGSDRLDRVSDVSRLAGGFTFTGTNRHFVQYRDAAAPFGYDVPEIAAVDSPIALYHNQFTQHYEYERRIELSRLLLRLEPRLAPSTLEDPGPRYLCAEYGLGPALIHYFVRSLVPAEVGVAEWPPASEFDELPLRRYIFRVEQLPERMHELMRTTPGIDVFLPQGPNVAVEAGFEHPINLRACPVFDPQGLVLIRGASSAGTSRPPIVVEKLPALGPVHAFAKVEMRDMEELTAGQAGSTEAVKVPLRLAPDTDPWRNITATHVGPDELGLLRQIAYRLGRRPLEQTKIAFTQLGAFLVREGGIESVPIGHFYRNVHRNIFVSAGYIPIPAVAPPVLHRAFDSPTEEFVFLHHGGQRIGIPLAAFVPLETALLDAQSWSGTQYETVVETLNQELPTLSLESPGFRPMRDVGPTDEAAPLLLPAADE